MGSRAQVRCCFSRALFVVCAIAFTLSMIPAHAVGLRQLSWHGHKRPVVVGYFLGGGIHAKQPYTAKSLLESGAAAKLDQINYSEGSVRGGHCAVADPASELYLAFRAEQSVSGRADNPKATLRGTYHQLEELKRRYPRIRILVSLEGKAEDFAVAAQPQNRRAFVSSCVDTFLRGRFAPGVVQPGIFDGIDVDWESPGREDAGNFLALLAEFRRQMNTVRPGLRLSVAVGDSPLALPGTDFAAVARIVDQVGVMNYDYAGPWSTHTGFVAPLFVSAGRPHDHESIKHSIEAYQKAGVPLSKMLMGLPFYGYSWTRVEEDNHGLFQEGDSVREDAPYHEIRALTEPFEAFRDPRSMAPWLFDGDTFWTYEDPVSVRYKVSYAARQHLAGIMIWELSGDTPNAELLHIAYRALHHPLSKRAFSEALMALSEDPAAQENEPSVIRSSSY